MPNFLTEHATENVWCTPDQDYQHIYKVARITGRLGVRRLAKIEWQTIPLPNNTDRFHVYSIGQVHPRLLGLMSKQKVWTPLSEVCNIETMLIDVYQNDGFQFPLHMAYLLVMGDRNIVIAVKADDTFGSRYLNPIFFKVYSNAYMSTVRAGSAPSRIHVEGHRYWGDRQALLTYQLLFHSYRNLSGFTKAFCNGYLIDDFQPDRFKVGDILEFIYDSTIYKVVDLLVDDLPTFTSLLDGTHKYLIHYPGNEGSIVYHDDLDMYLVKKETNGRYKGMYHHKNNADTMRMVTHKDYSIPVTYVVGFVQSNTSWLTLSTATLRLYLRHSGYDRPLVDEHNRIKELYRLPENLIPQAMLGVESTVPNWRADNLENSWYPAIMRHPNANVTSDMVQKAYGYNAISKLIADTPQRIVLTAADRFVSLPYGLRSYSTVFEYDIKGVLLGFGLHTNGQYYAPINTGCRLVEVLSGSGSQLLDVVYDVTPITLESTLSYRFYKTQKVGGVSLNQWVVANPLTDYTIVNGVLTWLVDPVYFKTAVKSDRRFLAYSLNLPKQQGVLSFTITSAEPYGVDQYVVAPLKLAVGRIELWLNGHALIRGLDYYLKGMVVYIVNKEYQVAGVQNIVVRGVGFCEDDMTTEETSEWGYVEHGLLSKNNRYDVRDDRVMKMVVRGRLMHRDQLAFVETHPGVFISSDVKNGSPYLINDTIVPMRGLTTVDTYTMRKVSQQVDKTISDYLTLKNPQPVLTDLSPIEERYRVYSPFAAKILYDLKAGYLWHDKMSGHYNEMDIRTWLAGYLFLLEFDPCIQGVDDRYVAIHPHDLYVVNELNVYQYTFLGRAIKYYLNDKVDISRFVAIKDGWL